MSEKTNTAGNTQKMGWISALRIFATLSVIFLHVNGTVISSEIPLSSFQSSFFSFNYLIMRWSVPVFFYLTGMLLLDPEKEISLRQVLTKYVRRILYALLIFGTFYGIIAVVSENGLKINSVPKVLICILGNKSFSHLWYLYELIGLYLLLPILKKAVNSIDKNNYKFLLVCLFIFDFAVPFISNLFEISIAFKIQATYPVFYFLVGYYFKKYPVKSAYVITGMIISLLFIILLAAVKPDINNNLLNYDTPFIAVFSVCLAQVFSNIKISKTDFIWKMDRLCFGVYLIHPFFIQVLYKIIKINPTSFGYYALTLIFIYAGIVILSFLSSWIMNLLSFILFSPPHPHINS